MQSPTSSYKRPKTLLQDLRRVFKLRSGGWGRNDGERSILHSRPWLRKSLAIGRTEGRPVQLQHSA